MFEGSSITLHRKEQRESKTEHQKVFIGIELHTWLKSVGGTVASTQWETDIKTCRYGIKYELKNSQNVCNIKCTAVLAWFNLVGVFVIRVSSIDILKN